MDENTPVQTEIEELADADPMAALLADKPHKHRDVAEFTMSQLNKPGRTERSEREKELNMPGRVIRRDLSLQRKFLTQRFYPNPGVQEAARRRRQLGLETPQDSAE